MITVVLLKQSTPHTDFDWLYGERGAAISIDIYRIHVHKQVRVYLSI